MSQSFQDSSIRRFFLKGQPLSYGRGDVILGNDSEPNGVYYIATGYVKAYSISDEGDEYVHIIYGQGEVFPIIWAYLNNYKEGLFYEALSQCLLWRMSRDWFERLSSSDVESSQAFARQLARQFQIFSDRLDNLEYRKAHQRVAYRLLFLASRFGVQNDEGLTIDAPVTHDLLASTVNLVRESVSREIEKLVREGIVSYDNHHITIKDVDRLVAVLGEPVNFSNWHLNE